MNKPVGATIFFIILLYCIGFLVFFLFSILTFPENTIDRVYFFSWLFDNSLDLFIEACFSLHITAILLIFSLLIPVTRLRLMDRDDSTMVPVLKKFVIVFLCFTLVFAFLREAINPQIDKREKKRVQTSALLEQFQERAEQFYKEGKFDEAITYISYYRTYIPNNANIEALHSALIRRKSELPKKKQQSHVTTETEKSLPSFSRKQHAYEEFLHGDTITSYYLFKSLADDYPDDADIVKYLHMAEEKLKEQTFFLSEFPKTELYPGIRRISFINEERTEQTETIHIEKMVERNGTFYFEDIEIVTRDKNGETVSHLEAPYGKYKDGKIIMLCLDKEQERLFPPKMKVVDGEKDQIPSALSLSLPPRLLHYYSEDVKQSKLGLPELWELRSLYKREGQIKRDAVNMEIINRLARLFSFFILSFMVLPFAWQLQVKDKGKPLLALLFIPFFPFILHRIIALYLYGHRLLFGTVYMATTFLICLISLVFFQGILLFFSFYCILRHLHKNS